MVRFKADKRAAFVAIVSTLGCLCLCVVLSKMLYLTNDDGGIQATLSGINTGSPFPVHAYVNVLVSYPLSWLYTVVPTVQWWHVYNLTLALVGTCCITYALVHAAGASKFGLAVSLGLAAVFDAVFIFMAISRVSFNIVPAIVAAGIAALLLANDRAVGRGQLVATAVLFAFAMGNRFESGVVGLCYVLLALLFVLMGRRVEPGAAAGAAADQPEPGATPAPLWKSPIVRTAVVLVCIAVGMATINSVCQRAVNGDDFAAYNQARTRYLDYPHDAYGQNPELYERVGWSRDLTNLVGMWYLVDERVTTQALDEAASGSANSVRTLSPAAFRVAWSGLGNNSQSDECLLFWLATTVAALCVVALKGDGRHRLALALNVAGSVALMLYEVYGGRVLYHSAMVVVIPSVVTSLVLMVRALCGAKHGFVDKTVRVGAAPAHDVRLRVAQATAVLLIVAALPLALNCAHDTFSPTKLESKMSGVRRYEQIADYCVAHPETAFVTQSGLGTNNASPWIQYPDAKPKNMLSWGGSLVNSAQYFAKLKANGLDTLTSTSFRDHSIKLILNVDVAAMKNLEGGDAATTFLRMQRDEYGAVGVVREDKVIDGVYVYHLVYEGDPVEKNMVALP